MSILNELKRRNVLRMAAAYIVVAWLVVQVVETIFPAFGFGDVLVRIVVIALAIGFLPVLVLTWAFEFTPEGLKLEKDIDRSQPGQVSPTRSFDRVVIALLTLAAGLFAFDKFIWSPQKHAEALEQARSEAAAETRQSIEDAGPAHHSIAVLPFVDMSEAHDHEYFADGMSEELLNVMAQMPGLQVTSRSSAFAFKNSDTEIPEIARQLKVAHILEGSVRIDGERIRVTAQLIDARTDAHLWSETYDRSFEDLFMIQDDIAGLVADQMNITLLGGIPKSPAGDPRAWDLYWKAEDLGTQIVLEDLHKIIAMYQDVLSIDPGFAPAWIGMGDYYNRLGLSGEMEAEEALAMARHAVSQGLALDPDYPRGHRMLGWFAMIWDNNLEEAARHYSKVNELLINGTRGDALLEALGRLDEAIELDEYRLKKDPLNAQLHAYLGKRYLYADRHNEAIASLTTAKLLSPKARFIDYNLGLAYLLDGQHETALKLFEQERAESARQRGLVLAYHALGKHQESDAVLAEYTRDKTCYARGLHPYRGEVDKAFEVLEACEAEGAGMGVVHISPLFRNLHGDPRWMHYLERNGVAPQQLEKIEFSVAIPHEQQQAMN